MISNRWISCLSKVQILFCCWIFYCIFWRMGTAALAPPPTILQCGNFTIFLLLIFFLFCMKWKGQKLSFQRPYWICAICLDSKNTQNEWKKNPQISTLWTWLNKQQQVSACASTKQFGSIWGNTLPNLFVFFHAEQLQKISWLPLFLPRWWNHHLWT